MTSHAASYEVVAIGGVSDDAEKQWQADVVAPGNPPPAERHAMTLAITGATGHLGRLVVESLLARGVPADQIVATGRNLSKISDLSHKAYARKPATTTISTRCARSSPARTGSSSCPAVRLDSA